MRVPAISDSESKVPAISNNSFKRSVDALICAGSCDAAAHITLYTSSGDDLGGGSLAWLLELNERLIFDFEKSLRVYVIIEMLQWYARKIQYPID